MRDENTGTYAASVDGSVGNETVECANGYGQLTRGIMASIQETGVRSRRRRSQGGMTPNCQGMGV